MRTNMLTINQMPAQSRVWIYQCDREFTGEEKKIIEKRGDEFINVWDSHGKHVNGAIEIFYNRFIVIAVDEQGDKLCGRAVDNSVNFIKSIEEELNVSLMNRMTVSYKQFDKVETTTLAEFGKMLDTGKLDENTKVFNNLVGTKEEFEKNWEIPVRESWHGRLLAN